MSSFVTVPQTQVNTATNAITTSTVAFTRYESATLLFYLRVCLQFASTVLLSLSRRSRPLYTFRVTLHQHAVKPQLSATARNI